MDTSNPQLEGDLIANPLAFGLRDEPLTKDHVQAIYSITGRKFSVGTEDAINSARYSTENERTDGVQADHFSKMDKHVVPQLAIEIVALGRGRRRKKRHGQSAPRLPNPTRRMCVLCGEGKRPEKPFQPWWRT